MKSFKKLLPSLSLIIFITFFLTYTSEASVHTLQVKNGVFVIAKAKIDDSTPYTGMYSLIVDGMERLYRQWFWYRIGPAGKEASLDSLSLTSVTPPTTTNPNTLTLKYTLPATFEITVNYVLSYPTGGNARLQKNVSIKNITATTLDYHLFEYSDLDISSIAYQNDNVEAVGSKIYQNGEQADGSGVTMVHESTLPPQNYDFDNMEIYFFPEFNDDAPTEILSPLTTYNYGDDMQFALQWDLAIPTGQSVSFTINDDLYYTLPVSASKTHIGCVDYGGEAHYTIAFDNLANSLDNLSNVKIIDFLPTNTIPLSTPPADGALYDHSTNSVTWNLPALAAGADQQTKQLSLAVNSAANFENEVLLVSDQTFPTRISDPTLLCNHPPTMNSVLDASIKEGEPFSLQIVAFDPDVQDSLSYSLSGAPTGMTISTSGLINYPAGIAGVYPITVTATDNSAGALSASRSFTLTVTTTKSNQPPVFTSTPTTDAECNVLYTYEITGTDPEDDTLNFGLIKAPLGMSISGNVISWTPTTAQAGVYVKAMINDGRGNYVYQEFNITVGVASENESFAINFTTDGNGSLVGTARQTVSNGASTTVVSAIPSTGYYFANWTGSGGFVTTSSNPLIVAVTTDQTIIANFSTTPPLRFTVTPTAAANGSIRPENSQTITAGTTTSFSVTPDQGYRIANVTGCGGSLNGTTFTVPGVTGNCTVSATFMAIVTPRSKGDLDGNGTEDIADALLALQFAIGSKKPSAADIGFGDVAPIVNGRSVPDGVIDIADAVAFLQKTVDLLSW